MENTININSNSKTFQVFITGISWKEDVINSYRIKYNKTEEEDLPNQFTLDIPMNVVVQAQKKMDEFDDAIETFVYNFLTHKFGHEVYHCQIFLPID